MSLKRVMGLESLSHFTVWGQQVLSVTCSHHIMLHAPHHSIKQAQPAVDFITQFFLYKLVVSDVYYSNGKWTVLQNSILTTPACITCSLVWFRVFLPCTSYQIINSLKTGIMMSIFFLLYQLMNFNCFCELYLNLILLESQGKDLYLPKVGGQDERGCSRCQCSKRHIHVPQAAKVKG